MGTIFSWLISTSIIGGFLVGCILLTKALFKNKLGARWHYCIWFLLVLKLLMPYGPQSTISVFNIFKIPEQITSKTLDIMEIKDEKIYDGATWNELDQLTNVNDKLSNSNKKVTTFMTIWALGVIVLAVYTIRVNVNLWLLIKQGRLCKNEELHITLEKCKRMMNIKRNIPLIKTQAVVSPALFGLFRPYLLLPPNLAEKISREELKYVLLHELAHFKRKDIAVYWLTGVLQIIHWFNPVIWYGFYKMRQDCEIACDALVLSRIEQEEYTNYGHTIINLVASMKKSYQPIAAIGMVGSKEELRRRIKMITLFKRNAYKLSIMSILAALLIGGIFLTNSQANALVPASAEVTEIEGTLATEEGKLGLWPLPNYNRITSLFGERVHPVLKKKVVHTGIDIASLEGEKIVAVAAGSVIYSDFNEGYGKTVIIDHGDNIVSVYSHCSELLVEKDTIVKAGDEIAEVGSTGKATGPHLHFEVRKDGEAVNPLKYIVQPREEE